MYTRKYFMAFYNSPFISLVTFLMKYPQLLEIKSMAISTRPGVCQLPWSDIFTADFFLFMLQLCFFICLLSIYSRDLQKFNTCIWNLPCYTKGKFTQLKFKNTFASRLLIMQRKIQHHSFLATAIFCLSWLPGQLK